MDWQDLGFCYSLVYSFIVAVLTNIAGASVLARDLRWCWVSWLNWPERTELV